jgi:cryptochrome
MGATSIIWFRKGLRIHDNPALLAAAQGADHLCPLFILDPWFLQPDKIGVNRVQFLLESLADLDASFRARGSRLLVLRGKPQEVLPPVFKEWGVTRLCFESDTEPYAKQRDAAVRQLAEAAGVEVHSSVSHTLYDPQLLLARNGGKPPLTMQAFTKLADAVGPPPAPAADPPEKLPPLAPQAASLDAAASGVPSLADIGYPPAGTTPFKGGETAALARMADYLSDKDWVCAFEKPKGNPALFLRPATTVLSPYLKFGCLSPRLFHAKLQQARQQDSAAPVDGCLAASLLSRWTELRCPCHMSAAMPPFLISCLPVNCQSPAQLTCRSTRSAAASTRSRRCPLGASLAVARLCPTLWLIARVLYCWPRDYPLTSRPPAGIRESFTKRA